MRELALTLSHRPFFDPVLIYYAWSLGDMNRLNRDTHGYVSGHMFTKTGKRFGKIVGISALSAFQEFPNYYRPAGRPRAWMVNDRVAHGDLTFMSLYELAYIYIYVCMNALHFFPICRLYHTMLESGLHKFVMSVNVCCAE